jgi:hypothetical protein
MISCCYNATVLLSHNPWGTQYKRIMPSEEGIDVPMILTVGIMGHY